MVDVTRRKTTETLQRDLDRIAAEAAAGFMSRLGDAAVAVDFAPMLGRSAVAHGRARPPDNSDEALHMVREGFARLGGVLSLCVLVDEPGPLADDLDWLRRMLGARSMQVGAPMIELLMRSYIEACSRFLGPGEVDLLQDQIGRAMNIMATQE